MADIVVELWQSDFLAVVVPAVVAVAAAPCMPFGEQGACLDFFDVMGSAVGALGDQQSLAFERRGILAGFVFHRIRYLLQIQVVLAVVLLQGLDVGADEEELNLLGAQGA